jgi:hypothetical protein
MKVSEHVKSPVLLKVAGNQLQPAASLQTPLVISANSRTSRTTDQDLRDSMPTYLQGGTFLLKVLAKELCTGRMAPEFVHHVYGDAILVAFKTQFKSYTRQYPPFSARQKAWTRAIDYWQAMSHLPEASVLTVTILPRWHTSA